MIQQFQEWNIKNIIWDFDGVLANINHAYYCFIKNHSKIKHHFKQYKYEDLNIALPIDKKYGAIELKTHKTLGTELDKYFCNSRSFYFDRPLYYGTKEALIKLHKMGYNQFVLSSTSNKTKKLKLIRQSLKDLPFIKIFVVNHSKTNNEKQDAISNLINDWKLNKNETVLIDDRIYNIYSALNAGIHAIRFRSEFTIPSPNDLKHIPEIYDIRQILK